MLNRILDCLEFDRYFSKLVAYHIFADARWRLCRLWRRQFCNIVTFITICLSIQEAN